jgi:F-type H+-transporting ATPase subunit gamma
MPNLIDLRRRLRSVQNTQQITKAMKMVSAAKLRRAQENALNARPYSTLLHATMASILANESKDSAAFDHPLLKCREEKSTLLLLLSGDKGLCGAFNGNVFRASENFITNHDTKRIDLELIGKRGLDYFRRKEGNVSGAWPDVFKHVELQTARAISTKVMERFTGKEIDSVYLLYNKFKSVLTQEVKLRRLLPVEIPDTIESSVTEYIYEQPASDILRDLLPKYVETDIYHAMLESAAAEHAARMTAMDSATRNAEEMIEKLTLHLNRVRQASITKEIIEIVSGAAALA